LYSCSNADDVIYKNKAPEFIEYGPYIYNEQQSLTNIEYDNQTTINGLKDRTFSKIVKTN